MKGFIVVDNIPESCKVCPYKECDQYYLEYTCKLISFIEPTGITLKVSTNDWDTKRNKYCPIKQSLQEIDNMI